MGRNPEGGRRARERKQRGAWVVGLLASAVLHAVVLGWGGLTVTLLPTGADRQVADEAEEDDFAGFMRVVQLRTPDAVDAAEAIDAAEALVASEAAEAREAETLALSNLSATVRARPAAGASDRLQMATVVPLPRVELRIATPQRGVVLRDPSAGDPWPASGGSSGSDDLSGEGPDRRRAGGITIRVGGAGCDGSGTGVGGFGGFDRFGGSAARLPVGRTGRGSLPGIRR